MQRPGISYSTLTCRHSSRSAYYWARLQQQDQIAPGSAGARKRYLVDTVVLNSNISGSILVWILQLTKYFGVGIHRSNICMVALQHWCFWLGSRYRFLRLKCSTCIGNLLIIYWLNLGNLFNKLVDWSLGEEKHSIFMLPNYFLVLITSVDLSNILSLDFGELAGSSFFVLGLVRCADFYAGERAR